MHPLFIDHLPYIIGGLIVGIGFLCVREQTRWSRRLAGIIFGLTLLYPCIITALYLDRKHLGEEYACLIYGYMFAALLGIIAGTIALIWIILYVKGLIEKNELGT